MNWARVTIVAISCIIALIWPFACSNKTSQSSDLVLEMSNDSRMQVIRVPISEVQQIGINERLGGIRVEVMLPQQYHTDLEKFTREMVGGKMVIKLKAETVFSGKIFQPVSQGRFSFDVPSEMEALSLFDRMGMKPSYHLRLSHEEVETSKKNAEILSNPMIKKAFEAVNFHRDLDTGIQYAQKAVESAPSEPTYREILGTFYYQQGNKQKALDELLTAERLSKAEDLQKKPGILMAIARIYTDFDDLDRARLYLDRVLNSDQYNLPAHLELGKVYEKMGDYDSAKIEYQFISEAQSERFRKEGLAGLERIKDKLGKQ